MSDSQPASTSRILTPAESRRVDWQQLNAEKINRPVITYWQGARRRLLKNPIAVLAMILLLVLILLILIGPGLSGAEYIKINAAAKNTAPNAIYWFGTDTLGRDWRQAFVIDCFSLLSHQTSGRLRVWRHYGLFWRQSGSDHDADH